MAELLNQLSSIYCTYLWLATLAAVNAQKVIQPNPDELQILNRDTRGLNLSAEVGKDQPVAVPQTRSELLQYSNQFTPDLNTVNKRLRLSERNRVITNIYPEIQSYPDHPDRFIGYEQVLCRVSVSGRSYWEIEWSGNAVFIAVSYKSICRKGKGNECAFGYNDQSWSLYCSPSSYTFRHNNTETKLPVKSIIRRIGVYVDHSAGTLSFYSVYTMRLIHTVQTTFTQPLYPGFKIYSGSAVELLLWAA
ncbi:tripartite motif-containing protein 16-like [Siphateles boraxobius]|uniref:tripartite motif-containing protein 16-like n=1 Tax=Siphateles boraxobius TaxID=180520 RepID=UPI00406298B9